MIVAKIILGKVTMQMLFAAMLIDAAHAALENREIAFRRIGVDFLSFGTFLAPSEVVTNVLFRAMLHGLVRVEMERSEAIELAFVGMQPRLARDVFDHD